MRRAMTQTTLPNWQKLLVGDVMTESKRLSKCRNYALKILIRYFEAELPTDKAIEKAVDTIGQMPRRRVFGMIAQYSKFRHERRSKGLVA